MSKGLRACTSVGGGSVEAGGDPCHSVGGVVWWSTIVQCSVV